jgi:hypothetical protein
MPGFGTSGLHVMAYDLERAMSLLGVGGLVQAIRAWDLLPGHLVAPTSITRVFE